MRAQGRPGRRGRDWPAEQRRPCCLESQPEPPQGGHGPGLSPVRSFLVLTDGSRPWTVGVARGEQCRDPRPGPRPVVPDLRGTMQCACEPSMARVPWHLANMVCLSPVCHCSLQSLSSQAPSLASPEPLHVPPVGPSAPSALSVLAVQAPSVWERALPCPPPLLSDLPSLVHFLALH